MNRFLLGILLTINALSIDLRAQTCEITEVTTLALPCNGNFFSVSVDLEVTNPASPGFTLAGNGVIYGTYLYADLPITVGPLLGDDDSIYEFIAWDVENADCQQYTSLPAANCGPICSISNFELEFVTCVSNQSAIVVFDFDYENPTGPTFDLYNEEGEDIGSWLYASLPVTVPFFEVNGAAPIILTVCDHNNADCCETFTLDAIDCNPNNCEIFSVVADPECTGTNFVVHLDFEYDNPASDSFTVTGNTLDYGTFGYNELPITLGPLNGGTNFIWEFVITDSESGNCTITHVLGMYHCPPPCDVLALEAMALECFGNEAYALEIGLDIEGEGDLGFAVFSETAYYGNFEYDNLPVIVPDFEGSGLGVDIVSVCDNENLGCCATTPFDALLCAGCIIYNLTAIALPCNDQDQIFVEINFDHQNTSIEGFEIYGNQQNYGEFSYEDLPVQVGPFAGDGSQYFEFVVADLVDPLCSDEVELGYIDCTDICELSNLTVETGDCTGNNTYVVTVDFDFQGTTGIGFDLYVNGDFYDFFSYDDLPLTIEEFPSNGTGLDTITVCENDNDQCCATISFEGPDCACQLFDLTAINTGCINENEFGVDIEFFYENLPSNSVDVFLDGVFIGFYNVDDIPISLVIPEGDGTAVITVCANDLNTCCDEVLIELMTCESQECSINELFAEHGDCNSDSTYVLDIDFNYNNLPTDSVNIWANDQFIGAFVIQPDFIHIEHFPVLDSATTMITVCAVGAPDCCATYTFATPDCSLFGQCNIWDLVADPGECTSDSTYVLLIDFNYQNLPTDSVVISANGNEIGHFQVTPEYITISNFPEYATNHTVINVCALGAPDCCDVFEFETPNCDEAGTCHIYDLVTIAGDCTSDSTYNLIIDYVGVNLPTDSVSVNANDLFIGHFLHNADGFTIENFPVLDANHTIVTLCAVGAPDCCDVFEFETPNCEGGGTCHLFDLVADPGECNGDSTYNLFLQYFGFNLPSDSVVVTTDQGYSATFAHNPDGITIADFPAYNTGHTTVTVCGLGAPDCCDSFEFETPDCGQGFVCEIYDLFAETGQCTSDSTFVLDVVFETSGLPTDSVTIYANDQYVGTYFNNPDFIHIENFPHLDGEHTTVTVCAVGAPDCCDTYTFETPFCTGDCIIYDIEVNVQDCNSDSSFAIMINFQYQNIDAGGFDVYSGDHYYGFFTFEQVPIEIPHFLSNQTGQYMVTVCESDNEECCTTYEFTGPVCGQGGGCDIYDLVYDLSPCDSAGNFYFYLNFNFQNTGTEGFNVVGNGNNYGNFSYDNLPVQIGPFTEDDTQYEFGVFDAFFQDCGASIEPGIVNCTVSNEPIEQDQVFQVFNNGSIPGIYARKDLVLSIFNSNGKIITDHYSLSTNEMYELFGQTPGLYIAMISYDGHMWPVKLVKAGY